MLQLKEKDYLIIVMELRRHLVDQSKPEMLFEYREIVVDTVSGSLQVEGGEAEGDDRPRGLVDGVNTLLVGGVGVRVGRRAERPLGLRVRPSTSCETNQAQMLCNIWTLDRDLESSKGDLQNIFYDL